MLIDLGMDRDPPDTPEPCVGGRLGGWLARFRHRTRVLAAAVIAMLALSVAALGGGASARVRLSTVFTLPAGVQGYAVTGDVFATVTVRSEVATLAAYRLRDGSPLWTAEVATGVVPNSTFFSVTAMSGVLLVVSGGPDAVRFETVAYAVPTGQRLWTRSGAPNAELAGSRVLVLEAPCPAMACAQTMQPAESRYELAAVDVRTGRPAWTLRLTGSENPTMAFDTGPQGTGIAQRMALLDKTGRIELWDLGSGTVLASRHVVPAAPDQDWWVVFLGDTLLVGSGPMIKGNGAVLNGFDAATLTPRWQSEPIPLTGMWPCGHQLCLSTELETVTLDPHTGARDRQRHAWRWAPELGEGHLLAYPMDDTGTDPRRWVLDADGRRLFELSGWDATIPWPDRGYALMTQFHQETARVWFGVLDVARRGVVPIGVLSGVTGSCDPVPVRAPGGGYIVCWLTGDQVAVIRYLR